MVVDGVGDVPIGEGHGVGVLAEGGGGVPVAEPGLGLQDLATCDEEGGDVVAKPVQGRPGHAGLVAEATEPAVQDADGQPSLVGWVGCEHPGS